MSDEPNAQEIVINQGERYSGEIAAQQALDTARLGFYQKGTTVFQLAVSLFAAFTIFLTLACIAALLAPLYWSEFMQFLNSFFFAY